MTASINTTSSNATSLNTASAVAAPTRKASLRRHLSLKWDLYGVVALMASSMAYGAFALAHVA